MKRHLSFMMLLALMLSVFSLGFAYTIQVGEGYQSNSCLPVYSGYSYTQQVYTQSLINYGGVITKIRFYYEYGEIANSKDWTIYLGHTQKTAFNSDTDWEPASNLVQVFTGDVSALMPAAHNWLEITLDTPFSYNNTDNLLLAVHQYTPDSGVGILSWGTFGAGINKGMIYNDSNVNPNPNYPPTADMRQSEINRIQLVFPDTMAPDAPLPASPLNGDQVMAGQTLSWARPSGSGVVDATGYDVYIDGNLVSGNQQSTYYTLTGALSEGMHNWYVIARNAVGDSPASETRTFEIVNGVMIGSGTASQREPFNAFEGYGRSLGLYTAAQIGQLGVISSLGWNVAANGVDAIPYKIYAKLTTATALTRMTWEDFTSNASMLKEGTCNFETGGWYTFPLDSPFAYTGGNLLIGVEANYGNSGAELQTRIPYFYYSSGTAGSHQYWTGISSIPTENGALNNRLPHLLMLISPLSPDPVLGLNPAEHYFGRIQINTTTSKTFTISNNGGGILNVTGLSPTSAGFFTVTNAPAFPVALATGETASFTIQYAPTAAGNHTATFNFTHGRATSALVVSGECFDSVISSFPYLQDFDGTWSGSPAAPEAWKVINANYDDYTWRQQRDYGMHARSMPYPAYGAGNSNDWLITPALNLNGINARIKWWDRIEHIQMPNAYKVKVSTTTSDISSFTTELANITCTNTDWASHVINLDAYTGQTIYLAFHQYYSGSAYYGFGIDDFLLEEMPTTPVLLCTPTTLELGPTNANNPSAYYDLTITNNGIGTLNLTAADISIIGADAALFEIDPVNLPFALAANQSGVIPVRYNPDAMGTHSAILRIFYAGVNHDVALSGSAVGEFALCESFEGDVFPPLGWNGTFCYHGTNRAKHGSASAYLNASTNEQYVFSTPMLTIESDSTLDFWASCSSNGGFLQVVYSTDRTSWTQLGSSITFPASSTWYNHNINLSSLSGNNYYLGLRTALYGCSYDVDMFIGPDIAAIAPGVPILVAPEDGATELFVKPTFTWNVPNTGGIAASYKIYCDTNNPPTTLIGTSTASSFTPTTGLPYGSTLYWSVVAVNEYGESPQTAPRSFTTMADPTIYDLPWLEDFTNTTFPPANWARYSGLYPTATLSPTTSGWNRYNFAYVPNPANPSARLRIYGFDTRYWLVTPPIVIPAAGYRLEFDLALTKTGSSDPVNPSLQQDDRFIVLIADNPTMVGATVLREWNNTGSSYVYNNIVTLGESQTIDLSAHAGTKYLAFYGQSTAFGGDNNVYVDNVKVRQTPTAPIFHYTPDNLQFETVRVNSGSDYQIVYVTNTGIGTLELTAADVSITGTDAAMFMYDAEYLPLALSENQSGMIPVRYVPTAEGSHSAILRMVYAGENHDVALSGSAVGQYALFERFESFEPADFPPEGWTVYNGGGPNTWFQSYTKPHGGIGHAQISYDSVAHNDWLISPKLVPSALNHTYAFYSTQNNTYWDERFNVLVSTTTPDITSFTHTLATNVQTGGADYKRHAYDLSSFIGQEIYVAIQAISTNQLYIMIDDVSGPDIWMETLPAPVVQASISGSNVVLSWEPVTGANSYKVYASSDPYSFDSTPIATVNTNSYTLPATSDKRFFKVISVGGRDFGGEIKKQ